MTPKTSLFLLLKLLQSFKIKISLFSFLQVIYVEQVETRSWLFLTECFISWSPLRHIRWGGNYRQWWPSCSVLSLGHDWRAERYISGDVLEVTYFLLTRCLKKVLIRKAFLRCKLSVGNHPFFLQNYITSKGNRRF